MLSSLLITIYISRKRERLVGAKSRKDCAIGFKAISDSINIILQLRRNKSHMFRKTV